MSRGYTGISHQESLALTEDAFRQVVGARLLEFRRGENGISENIFELVFDNGKVLELDGPYDEGVEASIL